MKCRKVGSCLLAWILVCVMLPILPVKAAGQSEKSNIYTIYYYDTKHTEPEDAALWIWEDGGSKGGEDYYFTGKETIDGQTWLKAEVELGFSKLGVLPKCHAAGRWDWQDGQGRLYDFTGQTGERNIYIIFGDSTIYTECPVLSEMDLEDHYVMVEYTRPGGDYQDWNIYTWNSGYGSEVTVPFEEVNGKQIAIIPVSPSVTELSFCMRRSVSTNPWAEKDGGDHSIKVPKGQAVVKAKFVQDQGVTETLPNGTGYEIDAANEKVVFFYRDDTRFLEGTQKELEGKVQVQIDDTSYAMKYDAKTERFLYTHDGLLSGNHTYCFLIDKERIIDKHNEKKDETGQFSLYECIQYEATIQVDVLYPTMDYNDNNLLCVAITDDKGKPVDGLVPVEVTADLQCLGGKTLKVDTELMEASFGVTKDTAPGKVTIPVTVKDQYGNLYEGSAPLTIEKREKEADFDWDEAVIYFTVTDRFFDGNAKNNDAYGIGDYDTGEQGGSSYHGGDFAGLTEKLDYLQSLGVNTIWITPIVDNRMAKGLTTNVKGISSYGYHGYWASDFETLNPHLGTKEEFQKLITALHERGMKLMVDVVLNHSGYNTDGKNITDYFDGQLDDKKMLRDSSNTVAGSEVQDSLAGLPDFVTEDEEVRNLLIAWQTAWVSNYDIDYFRVDTVKHVDDTTWAAFRNALTRIKPEFKLLGEQSGAGYATTAGKLRSGEMDGLLDFDFNEEALQFVTGNLSRTEAFLCKRNAALDNTATMGSFLGSHDEDGFLYKLRQEKKLGTEESRYAMMVAAALQITAKGQPVIYYGEEIGQTGANNYPYQTNRYDFDWALAEQEENEMLAHYRKLLHIRRTYQDVFASGARETILVSDEKGYDVFSRSYDDTTILVALQVKNQAQEVTFSIGKAGEQVTDLYNEAVYKADSNGKVKITIPAAKDGGCAILAVGDVRKDTGEKTENDAETEEPVKTENTGVYIVVRGDTLSGIAVRFGVRLQELAAGNPQIEDINRIYVGQSITLP